MWGVKGSVSQGADCDVKINMQEGYEVVLLGSKHTEVPVYVLWTFTFSDTKIIAFDKRFTREKEQEEFSWLKLPGSIREGFSEERAFELGLEDSLDFTMHSRWRD